MNARLDPKVLQLAELLASVLFSKANDDPPQQQVESSRYVTVKLFSAMTGYTVKAVDAKRANGTWVEGEVWITALDGRVLMDMEGYEEWVEKAPASRRVKKASESNSSSTARSGRR